MTWRTTGCCRKPGLVLDGVNMRTCQHCEDLKRKAEERPDQRENIMVIVRCCEALRRKAAEMNRGAGASAG